MKGGGEKRTRKKRKKISSFSYESQKGQNQRLKQKKMSQTDAHAYRAHSRVLRDWGDAQDLPGVHTISMVDDSIMKWSIVLRCPTKALVRGRRGCASSRVTLMLEFPMTYPHDPPRASATLALLQPETWRPIYTASDILKEATETLFPAALSSCVSLPWSSNSEAEAAQKDGFLPPMCSSPGGALGSMTSSHGFPMNGGAAYPVASSSEAKRQKRATLTCQKGVQTSTEDGDGVGGLGGVPIGWASLTQPLFSHIHAQ